MQPWSIPTTQCIFCAFRSTVRSSLSQTESRLFHNGARLARNRLNERSGRRDGGIGRFSLRKRQDKDTTPSEFTLTRRNTSPTYRRPFTFDPRDRIRRAVINLKESLEKARSNDPNYVEFASLDPEDIYWDSFEKKLRPIYARNTSVDGLPIEDGVASIRAKLVDAFHDDGIGGLGQALYFAFIDHVLVHRAAMGNDKLKKFADLRYPTEWYASARQVQREIHLHVGPTNSGKTYNALKKLEESGNGFYAGPLRLLAHEVYSRFRAKGIPCNLLTGDDVRIDEKGNAKLTSSTVEMVDISKSVDVAVIDEIQMMANDERGWAWTRAFLGATAKQVHVCGETRVVPLIRELAASMGDTLHIHQYERLNPLKAMSKSLRGNLKSLRKGDCVVSFSVVGIHAMKKQIEIDTGRRVAIVYGGLPPETRAQQAALFNDPDNDYDFLVASDAIGMGLNLSIKRIIFETVVKRGVYWREKLSVAHLKQIAGRAGRYRSANQAANVEDPTIEPDGQNARLEEYRATAAVGLVTCLDEADLPYIQFALRSEPEPIKHAAILPPAEFVDQFASHLPSGVPFEYVLHRLGEVSILNPRYKLCNIKEQLEIARQLEPVKDLSILSRYIFTAAPASSNIPTLQIVLQAYGRCVAEMRMITVADIEEVPLEVLELPITNDREYLHKLEILHKALVLYLWLSYRFVNVFKDREMAMHAKSMCEERINRCLLDFSATPKLKDRLQQMKVTGAAKADVVDAGDETLDPEAFGNQEELLDGVFATEKKIDQTSETTDETTAQVPYPKMQPKNPPSLSAARDSTDPVLEQAPQQDNRGPQYASAHG